MERAPDPAEGPPDVPRPLGTAAAEILDSLFCGSPVGLAVYDTGLRLVRMNPALERMHGVPAAGSLGLLVGELFPGPEGDRMAERLRTVLESGVPVLTTEHRGRTPADPEHDHTKEHQAALTLQHSLLLRANVPRPSPIETAHRYLPARAHAGVGGDWFDVLPLSGARVGLVVGDVTGRGIQAVARAGRLRTAVRTLANWTCRPTNSSPASTPWHSDRSMFRSPRTRRHRGSAAPACT